jgi:TonB family protein
MKDRFLALAIVLAFPACAPDAAQPPASPSVTAAPSASARLEPAAPPPVTPSPELLERLRKQREAEAQRKREHPPVPWVPSGVARWHNAIEGYVSSVTPAAQRALGAAAMPFASYLNDMHNRIHPVFADSYLDYLDKLPASDPQNGKHLVTRLEIVLTEDGHIRRMGVVKASGVAEFDAAALDSLDRAQPFGPAPSAIRSADGDVYVQWELDRDEVFACSTMHARPFFLASATTL